MNNAVEITMTIEGDTDGDTELAIDEAVRLIKEGYLSGGDANDTGSYFFTVVNK